MVEVHLSFFSVQTEKTVWFIYLFVCHTITPYKHNTRWSASETSAHYFLDVCYRREEVPRCFFNST